MYSVFSNFLSRGLNVCDEPNPLGDVLFRWVVFEGIHSNGNGGCILCERDLRIVISHCHFLDARCEGEGGALYVRNAVLHLGYSCFERCRTAPKGNQIGGNAWNVGGNKIDMSDMSIHQCWIDTQCGDSTCVAISGLMGLRFKNSSHCVDNSCGEDICLEYGDFDCTVAFMNVCNCSLYCAQSVNAIGVRRDLYSNIIDCKLLGYLVWQKSCLYYLDSCCFFRNAKSISYGSPTFSNCIGDFQLAGVAKVDLESTQKIGMADACLESLCFSVKAKYVNSMQIWTVALLFGYF